MGGIFVSTAMELAKRALALYLSTVPTYSMVYGAFATVPILLVWIYVAWIIVLLGATLTAYIPNLLAGVHRMRTGPGWQFSLALDVLRLLDGARHHGHRGYSLEQLGAQLRVDTQRLETAMEALLALDWVGQLSEGERHAYGARFVLLADPAVTPLQPLMQRLLLPPSDTGKDLYKIERWPAINLREAL
jgi:membrane protein